MKTEMRKVYVVDGQEFLSLSDATKHETKLGFIGEYEKTDGLWGHIGESKVNAIDVWNFMTEHGVDLYSFEA